MDLSSLGTGGLVLNKISAMVNLLSGRSTLPSGCAESGCDAQGGGHVDPGILSLTRHLAPPNSGASDFPILITYKSSNGVDFGTAFGTKWFTNFQRQVSATSLTAPGVAAPPNNLQYSSNTPPFVPLPPNTNSLTGSISTGWTETQLDGTAFLYDTNGILRTMMNPAGIRWTLSWDS